VTRGLALALLVALAGCAGSEADESDDRPICEVRFAAPAGFDPLDTFEEEYPDHLGVRLGYRDEQDREFHVLVGIPGEIGEGLPAAGTGELELTEGRTAEFVGRDRVWVVVWIEGDRCDPRAVIGNGFTQETFREALVDAGLAPPVTQPS
jgi:hypothetical protein